MENEVMTNGCSKDHTKERPSRGPTGDQATKKERTPGATSPQTKENPIEERGDPSTSKGIQ